MSTAKDLVELAQTMVHLRDRAEAAEARAAAAEGALGGTLVQVGWVDPHNQFYGLPWTRDMGDKHIYRPVFSVPRED